MEYLKHLEPCLSKTIIKMLIITVLERAIIIMESCCQLDLDLICDMIK